MFLPLLSKRLHLALALLACLGLAGCAHPSDALAYYWQSVRGHLLFLQAAAPLDEVKAKASLPGLN